MDTLFNGCNSDSEGELKINTDYAKNYNNWRQKEELNKLKTKYGDIKETDTSGGSSGSDSSSEEEEENELKAQFDKDFYKTLALLKNKDPKIYNQDVTFFNESNKAQEVYGEKRKQKVKKEKAVFLRDFERKIIVERDGKYSDSEDETELRKNEEEAEQITYVQEQKKLKESFKNALQVEEVAEDEEEDFLKPKTKSESEKQKEEIDYKEWLKGQGTSINENEQKVLKPLRDFWTNPGLDANEKFLRDYVLNNKYLDNNYTAPDEEEDENEDGDVSQLIHDSDENLSEDEKNIEKQEEFEQKYNFRFEEPDQEFIKRYPRTMENSLRRKDNRRSQKRADVKQRKEEDKLRKKEELKQLKALKRKEIEEKIEKLKEITGNDDIEFNDIDLDADFDPSEHDRRMTAMFNDDYYAVPEEDIKPEFPDIDKELEIEDTWDNYDPNPENYENEGRHEGPHCEDPDFIMDADYDPSKNVPEEIGGLKKRKRGRKSKFAELIAKEKPKFDPQVFKSYREYFDKYYSLDYEDMIGDIPCRFKYRKVVPNDYGLSVEEILMADDKELNKWCSLKKALQYKTEHAEINDVRMFKQKAQNETLKKKVLRSLYTEPEEGEEELGEGDNGNNTSVNDSGETKKKRRKKKKKAQEIQNNTAEVNNEAPVINKEVVENNKTAKNNVETKQEEEAESLKTEKRKTPKGQSEQSKKKRKIDSAESTNNTIEIKPHEEKGNANNSAGSELSQKKQTNVQNQKKTNIKNSKKAKLDGKMKKKKFDKAKKKDSKSNDINGDIASMDPERLKTYGINPKKLKNKLKYGKKQP